MNPLEYLATWWAARRAERRHIKRQLLRMWHLSGRCGPAPCGCREQIKNLTPKRGRRG